MSSLITGIEDEPKNPARQTHSYKIVAKNSIRSIYLVDLRNPGT